MTYPTVVFLDANMNMIQPLRGAVRPRRCYPFSISLGRKCTKGSLGRNLKKNGKLHRVNKRLAIPASADLLRPLRSLGLVRAHPLSTKLADKSRRSS